MSVYRVGGPRVVLYRQSGRATLPAPFLNSAEPVLGRRLSRIAQETRHPTLAGAGSSGSTIGMDGATGHDCFTSLIHERHPTRCSVLQQPTDVQIEGALVRQAAFQSSHNRHMGVMVVLDSVSPRSRHASSVSDRSNIRATADVGLAKRYQARCGGGRLVLASSPQHRAEAALRTTRERPMVWASQSEPGHISDHWRNKVTALQLDEQVRGLSSWRARRG